MNFALATLTQLFSKISLFIFKSDEKLHQELQSVSESESESEQDQEPEPEEEPEEKYINPQIIKLICPTAKSLPIDIPKRKPIYDRVGILVNNNIHPPHVSLDYS